MRCSPRCAIVANMFYLIACVAYAQDDPAKELPKKKKQSEKQSADSLPQPVKDDAKSDAAKKHPAGALPENLTLADALAQALRNSPQILVAEAKVNQAQADLNEVRHSVVHDVTVAYQRWSLKKGLVDSVPDVLTAPVRFETEIEIREEEARLVYMLGRGREGGWKGAAMRGERDLGAADARSPEEQMMRRVQEQMRMQMQMTGGGATSAITSVPAKSAIERELEKVVNVPSQSQRALPENLRKFFAQRVDLEFTEQPLQDVCEYLEVSTDTQVNFVWHPDDAYPPVTCSLKNVTVEAALQALADLTGTCFVLRDYGILVVSENAAKKYAGSPMISSSRGVSPPPRAQ